MEHFSEKLWPGINPLGKLYAQSASIIMVVCLFLALGRSNSLFGNEFSASGTTLSVLIDASSSVSVISTGATYTLRLDWDKTWAAVGTPAGTSFENNVLTIERDAYSTIAITDGGADVNVTFENSGSAYTDDFIITLDKSAGVITFNGAIAFTGSSSISVNTDKNIIFNSGSSITTVEGALTLNANQQAVPSTFMASGILINNATVECIGTGVVTVKGKSGTDYHIDGIGLYNAGKIIGGTTGTLTVIGEGSTSNHTNWITGVSVISSSIISSHGANVEVTGTGGVSSSTSLVHKGYNYGLCIQNGSVITSGSSGTVTVTGYGSPNDQDEMNVGMWILGTAGITSGGSGLVKVIGNGGGSGSGGSNHGLIISQSGFISSGLNGSVEVTGYGSTGATGHGNNGIELYNAGTITCGTGTGTVTVTGKGGGKESSWYNIGVDLNNIDAQCLITAGGSGTVTVTGYGGTTSDGSLNCGLVVSAGGKITSHGGDVIATGVGGSGNEARPLSISNGSISTSENGGNVTLTGNEMFFTTPMTLATKPDNTFSIRQYTDGAGIDIGAGFMSYLVLSQNLFSSLSTGTINIGDANTGDIYIKTGISTSANLKLSTSTGSAVKPQASGPDFTMTDKVLSFGSGTSLKIVINGSDNYTQLAVIGTVNLAGAALSLGGYYKLNGTIYTIVSATSVTGTFEGWHEGDTISSDGGIFLIHYTSTSVTLTDISPSILFSGTINPFSSCSGTASATQSFTVSGTNLTDDITVALYFPNYQSTPSGFEISSLPGTGYGNSLTLIPDNGTVPETQIYVRLSSSAAGSPEDYVFIGPFGDMKYILVTGTVNTSPEISSITANPSTVYLGSTSQLNVTAASVIGYCIPVSVNSCSNDYISDITIAGYTRTSTCDNTSGSNNYSLFADSQIPLIAGSTDNNFSISTGTDKEGAAIWIDYNQNNEFEESEYVFGDYAYTEAATYTGAFSIPAGAFNGHTRMRVRCTYDNLPGAGDACTATGYGETEDYNVSITGGVDNTSVATDINSYSWDNAGSLSSSTIANPEATPATTTTYTVTVTGPGGCSSTSGTTVTVTNATDLSWTGNAGTSNWNTAGNWSPVVVPSASTNVIIPETTTDPVVNEVPASPAICNSLTINAGGLLSVAGGKALTVNGILTNNGNTGSLELLSDENGTGSLLHHTNGVPAKVDQYITGNSLLDKHVYHFVSIPAQVVNPISGLFMDSYLYKLDPAQIETGNSYGKWVGLGISTEIPLNLNQGYMLYWPLDNPGTNTFYGNLNNGDFSCALAGHTEVYTFNLVPNPYPSAVNWGMAAGWTKSAGIGGTCYVWGSNTGNYDYIPLNSPTGIIPVGQAFIVMVYNEASPVLTVKNAARIHSSQAFYKSSGNFSNQLSIKADANGYSDITRLAFKADATEDFDLQADGMKMYGLEDAPQLYTLTADKKYSINSLPELKGYKSIPMNFETTFTGDVTLAFNGIESFPATLTLKLEDKLTSRIINLRQQPTYTFVHQPANTSDRFVLHFGSATGIDEPVSNGNIWINEKTVNISSPASVGEKALVEIYNAGGQCVFSRQIMLSELTKVPTGLNGFGVVRVSTGKNVWVAKGVF